MSVRNPELSTVIGLAGYFGNADSGQFDPRAARVHSEMAAHPDRINSGRPNSMEAQRQIEQTKTSKQEDK